MYMYISYAYVICMCYMCVLLCEYVLFERFVQVLFVLLKGNEGGPKEGGLKHEGLNM